MTTSDAATPVPAPAIRGLPVAKPNIFGWQTTTETHFYYICLVVLILMTRWNEDDLAGRLLAEAQQGGDQRVGVSREVHVEVGGTGRGYPKPRHDDEVVLARERDAAHHRRGDWHARKGEAGLGDVDRTGVVVAVGRAEDGFHHPRGNGHALHHLVAGDLADSGDDALHGYRLGGPEMAPQTPQRSSRPAEPCAPR